MDVDHEFVLDGPLSMRDVLDAIEPVTDEQAFRVLLAVYGDTRNGLTVGEIASLLDRSESAVEEDVTRLLNAGVLEERMACLVDGTQSEKFEVSEFGVLLLEDGVLALLEANDRFDTGGT